MEPVLNFFTFYMKGDVMIKAQISVEFSMLLLVSLIMVGITIGAVQHMTSSYDKSMVSKKNSYDLHRLSLRADEVCLSGAGSKRTLYTLTTVEKSSINLTTPCTIDSDDTIISGRISITNEGNNIVSIQRVG